MTADDQAITVTVLLCTRNGRTKLEASLPALLEELAGSSHAELVVVDNGSSDGTSEWLSRHLIRLPHGRVIRHDPIGLSGARNAGVRVARGQAIVFVDDDVHVYRGWLKRMVAPLSDGTADIVSGDIRLSPATAALLPTQYHRTLLADTGEGFKDPPFSAWGANMSATRVALRAIAFDERLGAGRLGFMEDVVWFDQATQAGYRAVAAGPPAVEHHPEASRLDRRSWYRHCWRHGRSSAFVATHYECGFVPGERVGIPRAYGGLLLAWLRQSKGDELPNDHVLRKLQRCAYVTWRALYRMDPRAGRSRVADER